MRRRALVPAAALAAVLAPAAVAGAQGATPEASEAVIALSFRGSHRAYPLGIFADRRIVNDVVGSMEIAVFHDPERDLSTAWFRTVFGEPIEFSAAASHYGSASRRVREGMEAVAWLQAEQERRAAASCALPH